MRNRQQDHTARAIGSTHPFSSFLIAGFECASPRLRSGRRLDVIEASGHERFAMQDYGRLSPVGFRTVREGVRWHLSEPRPYRYDFSHCERIVQAAVETETQIIWDLCHYGWPDDLDIFSADFIRRFAAFTEAFVVWLDGRIDLTSCFVPINEPSYFAWAAGEVGIFFPYAQGQGHALKRQLVRAHIAAIESVRHVQKDARFLHVDPLIHVVEDPVRRNHTLAVQWNEGQHEARDMLAGYAQPELGGSEEYLDLIGITYYPCNQWVCGNSVEETVEILQPADSEHRPLYRLLADLYDRYKRAIVVAETGTEGNARVPWLNYVAEEISVARAKGIPVEGLCWYPILDHPGWEDDRHCSHGLWGYPNMVGDRESFRPLEEKLRTLNHSSSTAPRRAPVRSASPRPFAR